MEPIVEEFTITLKYQVKVDTETGEMTTTCISRKIDKSNFEVSESKPRKKSVKKDESPEPMLILESNKYSLNTAAVELMNVSPEDKLDIKYEKQGKDLIPIIGNDTVYGTHNGNRVTKTFTVAYRGVKNEELSKYGSEFLIIPHSSKENLFVLKNKDAELETAIEEGEEELELPMDIDLSDLVDDADVTEVNSSIFKF